MLLLAVLLLVLIAFLSGLVRLLAVWCGLLAIDLLIVLFMTVTLTLGLALVTAVLGLLVVGVRHCDLNYLII